MWTKREISDFKDSIRKEGGDSIIKVFTEKKDELKKDYILSLEKISKKI